MALEIERRFLVSGDGWRDHVAWEAAIRQGYLLRRADGLTVRVRLQHPVGGGQQAWLTFKAVPDSEAPSWARLELEYPIPIADAEALLALAEWQVVKRRYGLHLPGGEWVVDIFADANQPLVMAEVELHLPEDPLDLPSWCVREITGRHELSNASLAVRPLQQWGEAERQFLWEGISSGQGLSGEGSS